MAGAVLFPTVVFFSIAIGGVHPLVSLRLLELGGDERTVGLVTGASYLGALLGAFTCRYAVSRLGPRGTLLAASLIGALSTAALMGADSWRAWVVLRLVAGYGLGAYYVVVEGWLVRLTARSVRGVGLAAYETVRLVALAAGPVVLSIIPIGSALVVAAATMLAAALL